MTTPTELPKQYDHAAAEARWHEFWDREGFFHSEPNPDKKPFTIVIPPPNVTGALHLGHALNNTLQDILVRRKRMQGYETLWVPGTDHAGIATQAVVERRLFEEEGKTRHDLGREGLVSRIWDWKKQYETRILGQLKEMGCSCDWERLRFTLDPTCARAVRHTFYHMFSDELIYRGKRLVNWDCALQTAVSDDEVFHETVDGNFWYFQYPVNDPKPGEPDRVTIATTRPETMLGDTAVAVHPDPAAALDRAEAELVEKLAAAPAKSKDEVQTELDALRQRREEMLPALITLRDMALDGRTLTLPLVDREIPLIVDEWAKPEKGTGCVKITPAHDPNDYEVGLRADLPMTNILNKDGTLNENAGPYQGQPILKARENVLADLEKLGLFVEAEERVIEIAHSDRSKTPIEPFLNDQWFVKMDRLAQSAIDAVEDERVKITPSRYAKGYVDWLSEKRDWPIGRQLWWGHQIPIWYCATATEDELKAAFEGRDDVTWQWDVEQSQWWICAQEEDLADDAVPGHTLTREEDVLDTWFSSALWPHSTLGWPEKTPELEYYYPTSVLITSRDILSLWVARMVLAGLYNKEEIPFTNVYIHTKILDKYGEGMSKSKGNGVDPVVVMEKFGADPLRFAMTFLATESQDVRLPLDFECPYCEAKVEQTKDNRTRPRVKCPKCKEYFRTQWADKEEDLALKPGAVIGERFEVARNFCNKLWNASRFALMNLEGYESAPITDEDLQVEDRWLLSRLATVTAQVDEYLDSYRYSDVARTLYEFAWDEFCSFYVEMVKDRLRDDAARPVAQRVLAHALDTLLRLLHPIVPFVTEEVWQRLNEFAPERGLKTPTVASRSITIAPWPLASPEMSDPTIERRFVMFQEVLRSVREIRGRQNIPPKTELQFAVRCDAETVELLEPMTSYFASMAAATATGWGPDVESPAIAASVPLTGAEVIVDLSEHIDLEAELERTKTNLEKLKKFVIGKGKKLENESFISRAPAAVVEKERADLRDLEEQVAATEAAYDKLLKAKG
jgi:valyl-tRNA synthetase